MKSLELKFRLSENDWDRVSDIHRTKNFAEDLSLHLKDLGNLPMDEADRATDTVVVHDIHTRKFRRCRVLVEEYLEKHFLAGDCEIIGHHGKD